MSSCLLHFLKANALGLFSPVITFVLYALLATLNGSTLDTETAFTTTALLGLVTHPANMIMTIVPQAVGSLAAFERIHQYLLEPSRRDERTVQKKTGDACPGNSPAVCLENVTINTTPSMPPVLTHISLVINKGSIVMCSGPVGSGKTTLAKAFMGEIPAAVGTISVSSKRIGSCAQSPWLPSGTFKDAICGFSPEDPAWYDQVVRLCCLDEDIATLPQGDGTQIGSRGLNLSGGQRQRVVCLIYILLVILLIFRPWEKTHCLCVPRSSLCPMLHHPSARTLPDILRQNSCSLPLRQCLEARHTEQYIGSCACCIRPLRNCNSR